MLPKLYRQVETCPRMVCAILGKVQSVWDARILLCSAQYAMLCNQKYYAVEPLLCIHPMICPERITVSKDQAIFFMGM